MILQGLFLERPFLTQKKSLFAEEEAENFT